MLYGHQKSLAIDEKQILLSTCSCGECSNCSIIVIARSTILDSLDQCPTYHRVDYTVIWPLARVLVQRLAGTNTVHMAAIQIIVYSQ